MLLEEDPCVRNCTELVSRKRAGFLLCSLVVVKSSKTELAWLVWGFFLLN